jgi:nicotinic acid phosphoribosyltransferase
MNQSGLYKPSDLFAVARDEAEVDDLTNNDIYKFLMLDFALANPQYRGYNVKWNMTIRSKDVRTADIIPYEALNEQLKATQSIQGISEAKITYFQ